MRFALHSSTGGYYRVAIKLHPRSILFFYTPTFYQKNILIYLAKTKIKYRNNSTISRYIFVLNFLQSAIPHPHIINDHKNAHSSDEHLLL